MSDIHRIFRFDSYPFEKEDASFIAPLDPIGLTRLRIRPTRREFFVRKPENHEQSWPTLFSVFSVSSVVHISQAGS